MVLFCHVLSLVNSDSFVLVAIFSLLSQHSSATIGLATSLKDGSINLSNTWTRQLSETTNANVTLSFKKLWVQLFIFQTMLLTLWFPIIQIELALGTDTSIAVGWRKKEQKMSAAGNIKVLLHKPNLTPITLSIILPF